MVGAGTHPNGRPQKGFLKELLQYSFHIPVLLRK
jgi:hypothetical protein